MNADTPETIRDIVCRSSILVYWLGNGVEQVLYKQKFLRLDSNQDKEDQNLLCYRYTTKELARLDSNQQPIR